MTIDEAVEREQREAGRDVTIELLDSYAREVVGKQFIFIIYSVPASEWAIKEFGNANPTIRYAIFEDGSRSYSGVAG